MCVVILRGTLKEHGSFDVTRADFPTEASGPLLGQFCDLCPPIHLCTCCVCRTSIIPLALEPSLAYDTVVLTDTYNCAFLGVINFVLAPRRQMLFHVFRLRSRRQYGSVLSHTTYPQTR